MRLLFLAVVLALGCSQPMEAKAKPFKNTTRMIDTDQGVTWRGTDKPGVWALYFTGNPKQVGCYEPKTDTYHKLENGKFIPAKCPVEVSPADFDKLDENGQIKPLSQEEFEKLKEELREWQKKNPQANDEWIKRNQPKKESETTDKKTEVVPAPNPQNFGLILDEEKYSETECFRFNGKPVDKDTAFAALIGDGKQDPDQFPDDRAKVRLTIVGPDKPRKDAIANLKADPTWSDIQSEIILKDYPTGHWSLKGKGFATETNKVTYHLTDAEGKLIYEGPDATGVFDGLRKKKKSWDIDWNSWSIGINPWTWSPSLGFSFLHIPGELIALVVAGIVVIFVTRSKREPPKPFGH